MIRPTGATIMMSNRPGQNQGRRRRGRRNRRNGSRTGLLPEIGGGIGSLLGMPKLGRALGRGIAAITGSGDYIVSGLPKENSLAGATPPYFGTISGSTCIKHREYLRDVYSSTDFNLDRYIINPGSSGLFPWLSQMAHNFEQYRILGLCVEFKSTSSNALASTNTALGVVGLVTQYEADDPEFENKQQFENYEGAQSCNPSQSMLHFIECAKGQNVLDRMYVRDIVTVVDDARFFDLGLVSVMTQGMQQVGVNIGELWVSYDIEFYKPKMPYYGANDPAADAYYASLSPYTTAQSFGPTQLFTPIGTIGTHANAYSNAPNYMDITFPNAVEPGIYQVTVLLECATAQDLTSVTVDAYDGVSPYVKDSVYETWAFYTLGSAKFHQIVALVNFSGQEDGLVTFDITFGSTTANVWPSFFVTAIPAERVVTVVEKQRICKGKATSKLESVDEIIE